jgi:hypothetical protein
MRSCGTESPGVRCASAAAVLLCFCLGLPGRAAGQVVAGRVIDAASDSGVAQARVSVTGAYGDTRRTTTAADGRFSVGLRAAGPVRVLVTREGYEETRAGPLTVDPLDTARVDVRLTPRAISLRPVVASRRPRRVDVTGVFRQVTPADSAVRETASAPGRRSIVVEGALPTPSACYRLAGAADRIGNVVTLNVQARPTGDPCPDAPDALTYKMTARGLPPGSYTLRVLHTYRGDVWPPSLALDTTVAVR